jgi:hypothetical protein
MRPPKLAHALLVAIAGESWAECVAGDLEEEFAQVCLARNPSAGTRWYLWQVVRSAMPLLRLRMRSGEIRDSALLALLGVAVPLLLLDRLWSFVYSQIPLKDGTGRAPLFLAINVFAICLGSAIVARTRQSKHAAAVTALAASGAAGVAIWASAASVPAVYVCLLLLVAPASSLIAFMRRRSE